MKRETWQVVTYILQPPPCSIASCLALGGGGDPKCNLQFVTLVGMVCYILKA